VIDSAHPLCRWALTLGCAAFTVRFRRSQLSERRAPLFELGLSSEHSYDRAQPVATATDGSHGLWFPSAHEGSRSTSRERVPLATGRPQGLLTLSAVSARRSRAGYVSRRQRSWDSPFGAFSSDGVPGAFPPGSTHMPFPAPVSPAASGGPARHGSTSGFLPPQESLAPRAVFSAARRRWLPWVFTFRGTSTRTLNRIPPILLPRALHGRVQVRDARRLGVSISSHSARPPTCAGWAGDRLRFSAPGRTEHSTARRPGYGFAFRRVQRCRRPPDGLRALRRSLPQLLGST